MGRRINVTTMPFARGFLYFIPITCKFIQRFFGTKMKRIVMKFGGSSVATADKIKDVAQVILNRKKTCDQVVVVLSAMGKTTDNMIEMAEELSRNPNPRETDLLISTGEIISASLMTIYFNFLGIDTVALTGFQAGIRTVGSHGRSKIDKIDSKRIEDELKEGKIVIVAGFQGINESGDITTLGRGGSDTSAVALAAVLGAECEIYTDVRGIYTVDPRVRKHAKKIDRLTYEETLEMANLGAKVIEPRSVAMAEKFSVPLYIALNTGDVKGTNIGKEESMEKKVITNISKTDNVLLTIINESSDKESGITECFKNLADKDINIDMIGHTRNKDGNKIISFTTDLTNKAIVEEILNSMEMDFEVVANLSKVSLIGSAMRSQVGIAARAFRVLHDEKIESYEVSTSEISISYLIDVDKGNQLVNVFADEFNL